ncbi:hypothetical protein COHA_008373 [Chlorella ohadii]|uniref:DNA helicase n=1 Tax=Chlorella ohadii TaxID=2649997 RepID=A0AAD5DKJ2_9CHLO|nr:hypothetical protein COHA_008373 [Chlorella ohadii]
MPSAAKSKKAALKKAGRSKPAAVAPVDAAAAVAPAAAAANGAGRPDPQIPADIQLRFPPSLSARQRAVVHAVGERWGLAHSSSGEGEARYVTLGPAGAAQTIELSLPAGDGGGGGDGPGDSSSSSNAANGASNSGGGSSGPTDAQLIALIQQHFGIDASDAFAAGPPPGKAAAASRPPAAWQGGSKAGKAKPGAKGMISVEEFIARVLPLLDMERDAEVAQAEEALAAGSPERAAAKGRALLNLRLTDAEGGLLGRTLLTLVNNKAGAGVAGGGSEPLPPHKLSPHDIVRLRPSKGDASGPPLAEGVVYRVRDSAITVAVDEVPDEGLDVPLRLEKMANQVTYQRLRAALASLGGEGQRGLAGPLVDVLFGRRSPAFTPSPPAWQPLNGGLDESQQRAVSLALAARDVALIHGPPGTGKTTAVIEVICQEVARGNRVLACAASNVAVDNLVERLAAADGKMRMVRVGHPARLLPQVLDNSLEARVLQSDNSALAKDCRKEMKALNTRLLKLVSRKDRDERRAVRSELRQLAKEERKRQEKAVEEVLGGAQVVCTTLTGVGQRQLERLQFDVVVIDEAAQAVEPACWAALLKGRKAVLAGDHLQLPPTVISDEAARSGLSRTLFERLQDLWGEAASEMLTVQYRMNSSIMDWSSQARMHVARLRELRPEALSSRLEISTVDGFQGREKEAIVISMVRSNAQKQVGFLADERRMNVAVTRARRHCALVADSDTVTAHPFLQRLIAYFEAHGEYASAGEYVQQ